MNVLIIGGAGYIGSHTVRLFNKLQKNIVVYDSLVKGHRKAIGDTAFVKGDILDTELLTYTFKKYAIDSVVHFAAFSLVGESMENPSLYYKNNLVGTLSLLDVMLKNNIKKIVFSSTSATYGEPVSLPIIETDLQKPTNVYGRTKLMMEEIMSDYSNIYGLKFIALRYFNACGADWAGDIGEDHKPETHLIPLLLFVAQGKKDYFEIFGDNYNTPDGTCIRDYIHVNDLAKAHFLALEALNAGKPSNVYNLGNGEGFSVKEILNAVESVVGFTLKKKIMAKRNGDPAKLIADTKKIKKELGWETEIKDIKKIIETAWKWHKLNHNGFLD